MEIAMDTTYIAPFIVIIAWACYKLLNKKSMMPFPGPKGYPIFGNLFQLKPVDTYLQLTEWAKEFGPVYHLNLAGKPVLVVSGKDALYEVLLKRGKDYAGRDLQGGYRWKTTIHDGGLFAAHNPTPSYQMKKKLLFSHLRAYGDGFRKVEEIVMNEMTSRMSKLQSICEDGQRPLNLHTHIENTVTTITSMLVFGHDISQHEKDTLLKWNNNWMKLLAVGLKGMLIDIFPWLRYLGHPDKELIDKVLGAMATLSCTWKERMLQHRAQGKDVTTNLLNSMFNVMDNDEQLGFTETDCMGEILQAFAAGLGTTIFTLKVLMANLILNPDVQHALQEESDHVLHGRLVTIDDRAHMPVHHATILEITRINHLAFGTGPRVCPGESMATARMFMILVTMLQHFTLLPATTLSEQPPVGCYDMIDGFALSVPPYSARLKPRLTP